MDTPPPTTGPPVRPAPGRSSVCSHTQHPLQIICHQCNGTGAEKRCQHPKRRSQCLECRRETAKINETRKWINKLIQRKTNDDYIIPQLNTTAVKYRKYIESQFQEGMTWKNWGRTWHIDHIIPLKYGGNPTMTEIEKRFEWTNTKPVWATNNLAKGNRYIG